MNHTPLGLGSRDHFTLLLVQRMVLSIAPSVVKGFSCLFSCPKIIYPLLNIYATITDVIGRKSENRPLMAVLERGDHRS